ncbi:MAG: hypothetical protein AABX14_05090, partial [Candidatus Aenigmatarchaeota archaeon]
MASQARINSHFGGRVSLEDWNEKLQQLDNLSISLTGENILKAGDFSYKPGFFLFRRPGYRTFREGDGEVNLKLGASYFEPCIALPYDSVGYDIGVILRGSRQSVENGFDTSIKGLGYPRRVEVPTSPFGLLILSLFRMDESDKEYYQSTTNSEGWKAA